MGIYVNPTDCPKEEWLERHGTLVSAPASLDHVNPSERLVCLVNNGSFTAAGVVYDEMERVAFTQTNDPRPRLWYSVPVADLRHTMSQQDFERIAEKAVK